MQARDDFQIHSQLYDDNTLDDIHMYIYMCLCIMFAMYENRRVSYTATSNWDVWMGVLSGQNTYIVDFFFFSAI